MPYPERIRNWWLRVEGNGDESQAHCQVETYTEKNGWVECMSQILLQVHHLFPESQAIIEGLNPDDQPAIIACRTHHVGPQRDEDNLPFTGQFTFHPDMGQAAIDYRNGNKAAYKEAAQQHVVLAEQGVRFWGGDEGSDGHYIDKVLTAAMRYIDQNPDDLKPVVNHQKPRERKRKHWSDDTS